jgi:uncharacterized Tic20 family protein
MLDWGLWLMSDVANGAKKQKSVGQSRGALKQTDSTGVTEVSKATVDGLGDDSVTDEWTIASLAHASILLTLILAFAGGVGALLGLVVPLAIYLSYRERSRFIAFHALQSLAYQGAGILVYTLLVAIMVAVVAVAWTISGLLSVVVIGFLLMPVALLITGLMVILLLVFPLVWVGYGLYGAYRIYEGGHFRYWLLGEWVEREVKV